MQNFLQGKNGTILQVFLPTLMFAQTAKIFFVEILIINSRNFSEFFLFEKWKKLIIQTQKSYKIFSKKKKKFIYRQKQLAHFSLGKKMKRKLEKRAMEHT